MYMMHYIPVCTSYMMYYISVVLACSKSIWITHTRTHASGCTISVIIAVSYLIHLIGYGNNVTLHSFLNALAQLDAVSCIKHVLHVFVWETAPTR